MPARPHRTDNSYQKFIEVLRETRVNAGLTQAEVAEALGKSQDCVSRCETGEHPVTIVEALSFADLYGISILKYIAAIEGTDKRQCRPELLTDLVTFQRLELTGQMLTDGINYAYEMLDTIDLQLVNSGSERISQARRISQPILYRR